MSIIKKIYSSARDLLKAGFRKRVSRTEHARLKRKLRNYRQAIRDQQRATLVWKARAYEAQGRILKQPFQRLRPWPPESRKPGEDGRPQSLSVPSAGKP